MRRSGPLITAVVVLGGLVGLMAVNASGGLVEAGDPPAPAAAPANSTPTNTAPSVPPSVPPSTPPSTSSAPSTPPAPAFPAEVVYAGNAADSPLAIAVAVKGGSASAYLCDGAQVESWLRGTAEAGRVDLTSKDGASRLVASLDGVTLAGTVTFAGQSQAFAIGVAAPPAGLYRGSDGATTVGWIILPDGSQVGIATVNGRPRPAPELDPADGDVFLAGKRIVAEKVVG